MQLFNSATRTRKKGRLQTVTRDLEGVEFLLAGRQTNGNRANRGAIVAFTSPNPGEGVSHVVQFFAKKLASITGKRTLVVKAARLRSLSAADLQNMPGIRTRVGQPTAPAAGAPETNNGNGNGAGKLDAEQFQELESKTGLDLLQALNANFEYVLIDCPSISVSHEAAMIAPDVDGVILVVEADHTKRDQIFRARQAIEMAQGRLLGMVLNRRRHVVPEWIYRRL